MRLQQLSSIIVLKLYTPFHEHRAVRNIRLSLSCGGGTQREEELKKRGWTRQFVMDEPRLSEAVELYQEIGYEVHLEQASFEEINQMCKNCLDVDCSKYKTIYIRKRVGTH